MNLANAYIPPADQTAIDELAAYQKQAAAFNAANPTKYKRHPFLQLVLPEAPRFDKESVADLEAEETRLDTLPPHQDDADEAEDDTEPDDAEDADETAPEDAEETAQLVNAHDAAHSVHEYVPPKTSKKK